MLEPCWSYSCKQCTKSIKVGETFLRFEDIYICSEYPKRHKAVKAKDCGGFKCKESEVWPNYCKGCRGNR